MKGSGQGGEEEEKGMCTEKIVDEGDGNELEGEE